MTDTHDKSRKKVTPLEQAEAGHRETIEALKALLPQAFTEGKLDMEALREEVELADASYEPSDVGEHYGLLWSGKSRAKKLATVPPSGTLEPAKGEGIDEDTTKNVIIEGDNLEVLRILQKSYAGRVKMIYIDPPYNTGNDFIYKDDFKEPVETYLRRSGQADEEGLLMSNPKASGRYHSNWLSMMYPRLRLARSLLSEDGVIFVSIDDNEAHNLRIMMDEIFGEENYLASFYIQVRYSGKTLAEKNDYQKLVEQVFIYSKGNFSPDKEKSVYELDKFIWEIDELGQGTKTQLGNREATIFQPHEYKIRKVPPSKQALKETWASGTVLKNNASGKYFQNHLAPRKGIDGLKILYKVKGIGEDGLGYRYFTGPKKDSATKGRFYSGIPLTRLKEMEQGEALKEKPIPNFYNFAGDFGNCRHEGGVDFRSGKKPIAFITKLIAMAMASDLEGIVLDFFAGSGTTADAVMRFNATNGGNRKYILVQLPEEVDEKKSGSSEFASIAEITKERVRRASAKIREEHPDYEGDLGFRVLKLERSNMRRWQEKVVPSTNQLISLFEKHATQAFREDWTPEGVVTEVMLVEGYPLDSNMETLTAFANNTVVAVTHPNIANHPRLLICLDSTLHESTLTTLRNYAKDTFVCTETALTDEFKVRLADIVQRVKTL